MSYLFIKICFKEKSLYYFQKKNLKKNKQKNIYSGFLGGFFVFFLFFFGWVFLGEFFIANPVFRR
jgi:hypothetical protein